MSALGDTIRARFYGGLLPMGPAEAIYAGYGDGATCSGCTRPILAVHIQYDLEMRNGETFRLHLGCFGLWENACTSQARGEMQC
jgi:hypothetical protein